MKQIINLLLLPFHLLFYMIHYLVKECFRWLFKQDFESLNVTIQNQRNSIDKKVMKIQDLEKIVHKNELVVELLKKLKEEYSFNFITITKEGEPLIISTDLNIDDATIIGSRLEYKQEFPLKVVTLNTSPLESYYKYKECFPNYDWKRRNLYNEEKESYLQIVDFQSTIKNKGYATATFEVFEKLAKQMGYSVIVGYLSSIDFKDGDPSHLKYFYEKLGFEVVIFEKGHKRDDDGLIFKQL
ncbi:hypothetical protein [Capnocytophaga leadbetteri]|uniref:hypothetical protein n=1 Tax=Capnocytophaga leadbetteri TaxID=327575 RepID=UPI0026E99049|nr:hypothetical protein [Capnocytophaga leadbetteri]